MGAEAKLDEAIDAVKNDNLQLAVDIIRQETNPVLSAWISTMLFQEFRNSPSKACSMNVILNKLYEG